VREELCVLSREQPGDRVEGRLAFQTKYPILDELLDAVFGLLPSSSLLCEQGHSILRGQRVKERSEGTTDLMIRHTCNTLYVDREKIRQKKRKAAAIGVGPAPTARKQLYRRPRHNALKQDCVDLGTSSLQRAQTYAGRTNSSSVPGPKYFVQLGITQIEKQNKQAKQQDLDTLEAKLLRQPKKRSGLDARGRKAPVNDGHDLETAGGAAQRGAPAQG
jgi:hypothetical protein